MKIKVLGSSSGWAFPRLVCDCRLCSSTNERDKRLRSSIFINDSILIDAGPDIYHQLLQFKICNIKSILLTHSHPDHIFGLHDLNPKKCKIMKNVPIYGSEHTWKVLDRIFPNSRYRKETFKDYKSFELHGLKITPVPVVHSENIHTVGFVINDQNIILGYFPDFLSFKKEEDMKYFEVDCLFLDGSTLKKPFYTGSNKWGHINIMEGIILAKKCGAKKTIFTHLGHRTPPYDDLSKLLRKKGEIYAAFDGMEIEL
ncbi:MAG: MBL fold metallo-hydrolase [Candidatus Jordarchaeum sp.]|uniref:MBL fold metallo-hydrolase n=1 Tax=Candidatus Jordarchaeum sp. TaxID=2823881 RepID=UPI00404A3F55